MGKGGGVRWWCGQAVQHGAVPCPTDAGGSGRGGGEGVVPTTGHMGGRERVATRWHALSIGGVVPVVAGVGYGASQQEKGGETGRIPYGGVAPVVAGWAVAPVSGRGRARQGVCYVAVGRRLAGGGGEFETT